jgi:peroxiredoxin (alkyl hydroperoxide reductase subunit C)
MDELVRMVKALQFHENNGQVCPAGWMEGEKGMDASPEGVEKYLSENYSSL